MSPSVSIRDELRERVAIKAQSVTTDARGAITEAFTTTTATVWAKVEADNAGERTEGSQVEHTRRYTVTMRYRTDVASTGRLTWGSRTLKIVGWRDREDERRRFLVLDCEECPA